VELRESLKWVACLLTWNNEKDKANKRPIQPGGASASSTDPNTWHSFTAVAAMRRSEPFAYALALHRDAGITVIDLDKAISRETGEIHPFATEIIEKAASLTEISISGNGFHILVRGSKPWKKTKFTFAGTEFEIEVFDDKRFLVITGDLIADSVEDIVQGNEFLEWFHCRYEELTEKNQKDVELPTTHYSITSNFTSSETLERAFRAKNGEKVRRLYYGDICGYASKSEAEMGLASHLAFYQRSQEILIALLRSSRIRTPEERAAKEKKSKNYYEITVANALAEKTDTYKKENSSVFEGGEYTPANRDKVQNRPDDQLADSWLEIQPLRRQTPESTRYPLEALPDELGGVVRGIEEVIQAPTALIANSVLAAVNLATQAHGDIEMRDGRTIVSSLFAMTIGTSGERKSTADGIVLYSHREYEKELRALYREQMADYRRELFKFEAKKKAAERALKSAKEPAEMDRHLADLDLEPEAPILQALFVTEPTAAALLRLLDRGRPSIGLISDEAGAFIGGHAMSKENALSSAAILSKLWDGQPVHRARVEEGLTVIAGRRLAAHLMMQPIVMERILSNPELMNQGLVNRFLISWPASRIGWRALVDTNVHEIPTVKAFHERLSEILRQEMSFSARVPNELEPARITLEDGAHTAYTKFYQEIETAQREGGAYATIQGFASKAAEQALRLAATFSLYRSLGSRSIGEADFVSATKVVLYHLCEALRMFEAVSSEPELLRAERLLKWLHKRESRFVSLAEIYQFGPPDIRSAQIARVTLGTLERHGYVRMHLQPMVIDGVSRNEVYEVRDVDG
jgi:hypothetical protein